MSWILKAHEKQTEMMANKNVYLIAEEQRNRRLPEQCKEIKQNEVEISKNVTKVQSKIRNFKKQVNTVSQIFPEIEVSSHYVGSQ